LHTRAPHTHRQGAPKAMSPALQNAIALAARGNPILPLFDIVEAPDGTLRCMCGASDCHSPGKHPHHRLAPAGLKDAVTDVAAINAWAAAAPGANFGMVTGVAITVLDQDGPAGRTAVERLKKVRAFPPTWRVSTGREASLHYYFRTPDGVTIPNSAGKIDKGIDIRGVNGYVVLPGSRHITGNYYTWWADWHPSKRRPALFPTWILDHAKVKTGGAKGKSNGPKPIEEWRALAEGTFGEGERNDVLTRFAGHLLSNPLNDFVVIHTLLQAWNLQHCRPPLPANEVENTVASIAERELKKVTDA
jgi:Bifunctional DNA primase/polymerase, N-terminal/Primase C terminal 1 (PriCT-1)